MSEWIPVTERFPEDGVGVLTCDKQHGFDIMGRYTYSISGGIIKRGWESIQGFRFLDEEEPDIVAWMSLPEPYEVNANDNV